MSLAALIEDAAARGFTVFISNIVPSFWQVRLSQGDAFSAKGLDSYACAYSRTGETLEEIFKLALDNAQPGKRWHRPPPKEELSDLLDDDEEDLLS